MELEAGGAKVGGGGGGGGGKVVIGVDGNPPERVNPVVGVSGTGRVGGCPVEVECIVGGVDGAGGMGAVARERWIKYSIVGAVGRGNSVGGGVLQNFG